MAEGRRLGAERLEQRDLHASVRDMVVAPDDMGDAHVDVVGDGRQRIEIGAVLADQDRIGERGEVDRLLAAHKIVPLDLGTLRFHRIVAEVRQQETPVRPAPVGLVFRDLRMGKLQRLAAIDRRQPARAADLAPEVQLLRRLVAGVEQSCPLQLVDGRFIDLEAPRLVFGRVLEDAEPMQVVEDRVGDTPAWTAPRRCRRSAGRTGRCSSWRTAS